MKNKLKGKVCKFIIAGFLATAVFGLTGCQKTSSQASAANSAKEAASESSTSAVSSSASSDQENLRTDSELYKIRQAGKIVVATSGNYAPMTFVDDKGELTGIDVEMAKKLGEILGVKVEFVTGNISGLLPSLQDGKVDIICSSMSMTDERKKQIDFSIPYMLTEQIGVCRKADNLEGLNNLKGLKVGVIAGTPAEAWLMDKGTYSELKNYPGNAEAFLDLKNGAYDMYMCSKVVAAYYINNDKDTKNPLMISGQPAQSIGTGIALKKGEPELKAALDKAVQQMLDDGTIDTLGEKYLGIKPSH